MCLYIAEPEALATGRVCRISTCGGPRYSTVPVQYNRVSHFRVFALSAAPPREGSARPQLDRALAITNRIAGRTAHLLGSAPSYPAGDGHGPIALWGRAYKRVVFFLGGWWRSDCPRLFKLPERPGHRTEMPIR